MGTLAEIAGKSIVCDSSNVSTGRLGCQSEAGTPLHLFRLPKGFTIPKDTEFNKAYLMGLIQQGTLIPIVDANSFESTSADDSYYTSSSGIDRLSLKALPKYSLMFQEGHEFYKQMSKLDSYKNSDFIIGDDLGNLRIAVNSNGDYVGFSAGQVVSHMRIDKVQGGDPESKTIMVQFINRRQWDTDYEIIESASLDFDLIDIQGVNPVVLKFTEIFTQIGQDITFSAFLASDKTTPVLGLSMSSLVITKTAADGTKTNVTIPTNATQFVASGGVYTVFVNGKAVGDVFTVALQQTVSSVDYPIINLGDVLYSSNTESGTIVSS